MTLIVLFSSKYFSVSVSSVSLIFLSNYRVVNTDSITESMSAFVADSNFSFDSSESEIFVIVVSFIT